MNDERRFTAYAEFKAGTNNKFYEVEAIELEDSRAKWIFRWGRIGTAGQSKEGTTYSFGVAKRMCDEQFEKKEKKGYREVSPLEALASAGEEVTERKRNGLEEVEIDIPRFHAGSSEKRCRDFCEKYLSKLNVIRGSRWDLDQGTYRKQVEAMLKQYCTEYKRIKGSKTHGYNVGSFADTAMSIFFRALRDDAGVVLYGYCTGMGAF